MMIILVRHGEATHHTQRLTGGWTDSQLTDKGRSQIKAAAVKLAKDFAGRNCKLRILASDLQRASASAQIIAEELGFKGKIEHCRFLREKNNGIAAGMTEEEAKKLAAEKGIDVAEDAGRGWRQVVASPRPKEIVEIATVKALMNAKHAVIAAGGGGIPVVWEDKYHLKGVPAVIDKDFASECMAEQLDADMLIILTAVEKVAINFGKPDQKGLDDLIPADARKYIEEKQFAPGSMLPKVQAALSFAESKPGRVALITLLEKAADGISGKTGTRVHQ